MSHNSATTDAPTIVSIPARNTLHLIGTARAAYSPEDCKRDNAASTTATSSCKEVSNTSDLNHCTGRIRYSCSNLLLCSRIRSSWGPIGFR